MKTTWDALEEVSRSIAELIDALWSNVTPALLSIVDWMDRHWI